MPSLMEALIILKNGHIVFLSLTNSFPMHSLVLYYLEVFKNWIRSYSRVFPKEKQLALVALQSSLLSYYFLALAPYSPNPLLRRI